MNKFAFCIVLLVALAAANGTDQPQSATDLAMDMYNSCLQDFSTACVRPKAMHWFSQALTDDEVLITDRLSIVSVAGSVQPVQQRSMDKSEQLFNDIDNYLGSHALRIKAPEFFQSREARDYVPDFLLNNALTQGALVPLADPNAAEGRGMLRKVVLPFLFGLKIKTFVMVPLALALIALKTWKAMTLGLLSLVLSGALVIFKIAKPKVVNYEVVHYPHHHHVDHIVEPHHIEHIVPHHIEHVVPHHLDHHHDHHLEHHIDHHLEIPHHVEHVEHVEHAPPGWDPHAWARSSQEPKDGQDMAYAGQKKR